MFLCDLEFLRFLYFLLDQEKPLQDPHCLEGPKCEASPREAQIEMGSCSKDEKLFKGVSFAHEASQN